MLGLRETVNSFIKSKYKEEQYDTMYHYTIPKNNKSAGSHILPKPVMKIRKMKKEKQSLRYCGVLLRQIKGYRELSKTIQQTSISRQQISLKQYKYTCSFVNIVRTSPKVLTHFNKPIVQNNVQSLHFLIYDLFLTCLVHNWLVLYKLHFKNISNL